MDDRLTELLSLTSPPNLRLFEDARARLQVAQEVESKADAALSASPFFGQTPEFMTTWARAIQEYKMQKNAIDELTRQKGALLVRDVDLRQANNELKILDAFYTLALGEVTESFLSEMEITLTSAYQFIYDKPKRVKLAMEEFRGRKLIKLNLILTLSDGTEVCEDAGEDEGYSARTTLGTILLCHFIVASGAARFLIFDETLSGHEDQSLSRFMTLLTEFRDGLGFEFLIVTHDYRRLEPFCDKLYRTVDGKYSQVSLTRESSSSGVESPEAASAK